MQTLTVPQGEFKLARYPYRAKEQLRAWDAADEYLLHHLHDAGLPAQNAAMLILNDDSGALATALAPHHPQALSDSYLTHQATLANLQHNDHAPDDIRLLHSLAEPTGPFDLILCKIPKSLSFLEDLLHRIRPHLHAGTLLIGAGMARNIHTSTLELFERIIGPTRTSLAQKKARLIFSTYDNALAPGPSPYPTQYALASTEHTLISHANVFSRERLDIGTRLLLEHLPASDKQRTIIDLCCGNGIIGLVAAMRRTGGVASVAGGASERLRALAQPGGCVARGPGGGQQAPKEARDAARQAVRASWRPGGHVPIPVRSRSTLRPL